VSHLELALESGSPSTLLIPMAHKLHCCCVPAYNHQAYVQQVCAALAVQGYGGMLRGLLEQLLKFIISQDVPVPAGVWDQVRFAAHSNDSFILEGAIRDLLWNTRVPILVLSGVWQLLCSPA
jgi:hypothetical protein